MGNRDQQISEKDVMTVRPATARTKNLVPADRRNKAVLSAAQATELASIGGAD